MIPTSSVTHKLRVKWLRPPEVSLKLTIDGSTIGKLRQVVIGEALRDHLGYIKRVFLKYIRVEESNYGKHKAITARLSCPNYY